jgi:hypothetical protein
MLYCGDAGYFLLILKGLLLRFCKNILPSPKAHIVGNLGKNDEALKMVCTVYQFAETWCYRQENWRWVVHTASRYFPCLIFFLQIGDKHLSIDRNFDLP